jgi:hypothetical protein
MIAPCKRLVRGLCEKVGRFNKLNGVTDRLNVVR